MGSVGPAPSSAEGPKKGHVLTNPQARVPTDRHPAHSCTLKDIPSPSGHHLSSAPTACWIWPPQQAELPPRSEPSRARTEQDQHQESL